MTYILDRGSPSRVPMPTTVIGDARETRCATASVGMSFNSIRQSVSQIQFLRAQWHSVPSTAFHLSKWSNVLRTYSWLAAISVPELGARSMELAVSLPPRANRMPKEADAPFPMVMTGMRFSMADRTPGKGARMETDRVVGGSGKSGWDRNRGTTGDGGGCLYVRVCSRLFATCHLRMGALRQ